ncbi:MULTISPECIES: glycosyltransferase [Parapedobacter]|uniref:glycosyltransferase n=1 Tax=Parapedobacter TaxID=416949 RepID=UPI0033417C3A
MMMTVDHPATPAVSVLMTAYNAALYIREAIQSVLDQTFGDFELIVYDDGSTDGTSAIAKGFGDPRIRLIADVNNKGITHARQAALRAARGKYIAILDSDDVAFPSRLEKQYQFLEAHPDVVLCGGNAVVIDESGNTTTQVLIPSYKPEELKVKLFFNNIFVNSTVMYRRAEVLSLGGYRDREPAEDYDLFVRLADVYEIGMLVEEYFVRYRLHSNNSSYIKHKKLIEHVREIKREQLASIGVANTETYVSTFEALIRGEFKDRAIEDFYELLVALKSANLTSSKLPQTIFEKELFDRWYLMVTSMMPKKQTASYLLRKGLFKVSLTSFKQKRRIFKFWLRSLVG